MFYIFHGSNVHSQKEDLAKTTTKMGDPSMLDLNTTRLAPPLTFNDLEAAAAAMPFLAEYRLVIVENYLSSKPPKADIDKLITYLPEMPDFTRLFFLENRELPKKDKLLKLAEKAENGFVKLYELPEGRDLERWIQKQVKARHGRIQPNAVRLLAGNTAGIDGGFRKKGPDYQLPILAQEIEKLVLYKGEDEISPADVQLLSPYAAEINIFDLVDAIGNRNNKQATQLLQNKLHEGADPFYLFAMIVRQFRLLIQVKSLADQDQRPQAISKNLRMHSFVAGKLYQQCQGFSMEQLEKIYAHLLEIDIGVKTGKQEMVTALHLFVAALTV